MNKATLKQLAQKQATASAESNPEAPQKPIVASETKKVTNSSNDLKRLQAQIYAALVGGSDFLRTQAGVADICRAAYARSKVAVRIWQEAKHKESLDK